jgi:predicted RNA-binding Zn ribbon-like protein
MKGMTEKFLLNAGHLALDFANTLDNRYHRARLVELLPTYESFLEFAKQSGMITASQARKLLGETNEGGAKRALKQIIELREALYFLFRSVAIGQSPGRSRLQTLNRFLVDAYVPEAVVWQKPAFTRHSRGLTETPLGPLWPIVDAAVNLLTSPARHHVSECRESSCRWLFLDRSKNHSRRWCDMRICGNRSKAQRFQSRRFASL